MAGLRDEDGLVLLGLEHVVVRSVCNGKDVWGKVTALLTLVELYHVVGVERKTFVRVDCDQEEAGVSLR